MFFYRHQVDSSDSPVLLRTIGTNQMANNRSLINSKNIQEYFEHMINTYHHMKK